ncbi:hypothetical protein [Corynebacterium propinquum]|uniref:hypothetical protein n=1 Tax=Corynebacterium propinquum TaxID=43769 RepID=UPI0006658AD2|nr:hypothetical protein [Corynebacterium propinquum]MDK4282290.1 hypothetical protein [Corynebacterium propinquum]MDK4319685.1 hypothetical protein [Corynebacterium propinquum]PZQ26987.1 MAG: hypothetical protein DI558_02515 [Corynebacterium propinquum]WKS35111.1 hypothetical protein NLL50_05115 [Corynebacterium propinquum]WKS41591.1 hypothetical protein NLL41_05125 [Corynebacterium propinquum]
MNGHRPATSLDRPVDVDDSEDEVSAHFARPSAGPSLRVEAVPAHAQDHWLDEAETTDAPGMSFIRRFFRSSFSGSTQIITRVFGFFGTTPGKMVVGMIVLTAALLAAGLSMANSVSNRQSELNHLLTSTEPMSNSAHKLYMSLSLADTIATTGFVQAGVEPENTREQYLRAIDSAAAEATSAVLDSDDDEEYLRQLAVQIQRQLPVYTGLVEAARTNNRAGNAVGAAYMSNASAMMRDEILPAAASLFRLSSNNVSEQQDQLTRPQWVPLSGLVAALLFLGLAQYWLWRISRRRFNRGFAAATVMMVVALLWVSGTNVYTWHLGNRGFTEASTPWDSLTQARIDAQRTRTEEILALVQRRTNYNPSLEFSSTNKHISAALDDYSNSSALRTAAETSADEEVVDGVSSDDAADSSTIDEARTALQEWDEAKAHLLRALDSGNYEQALALATDSTMGAQGSGADSTGTAGSGTNQTMSSAAAFEKLDAALATLIANARDSMRSYLSESLAALNLVAAAVSLLSLLSVLAIWLGIRPRMVEYL